MTDRIKRMMDRLKVDKFPFCAEKARLVIESWKQHGDLHPYSPAPTQRLTILITEPCLSKTTSS